MESLSAYEIAYVVFILIFSFAVRGGAGFGGLNGPLLMVVLPAKVVIPALVFLGVVSSGAIVARDHRHIDWQAVRQSVPFGLLGTVVGLWLFNLLDTHAIEKGLGIFLLCYGSITLWPVAGSARMLRISPRALAAIMGTLAGAIGTMFGAMAGIFVAVFLDMLKLAKQAFRATIAATLMVMGIARAAGYVIVDAVTADVVILVVVAMPLIAVGVVLGNRMHAKLNQRGFSRLVGILFLVMGAFLFLR
jgi:uncharacterized membrane protein YfcA